MTPWLDDRIPTLQHARLVRSLALMNAARFVRLGLVAALALGALSGLSAGCGASQPSVEAGCGEQADYERPGATCARLAKCDGGSKPTGIAMWCEAGGKCFCGWRLFNAEHFGPDDFSVNAVKRCSDDSCDLDTGCCADWFFGSDGVATR